MLRYEDIARSITARHLATPLADATTAAPNERGSTALQRLKPHAFDQAPCLSGSRRAYRAHVDRSQSCLSPPCIRTRTRRVRACGLARERRRARSRGATSPGGGWLTLRGASPASAARFVVRAVEAGPPPAIGVLLVQVGAIWGVGWPDPVRYWLRALVDAAGRLDAVGRASVELEAGAPIAQAVGTSQYDDREAAQAIRENSTRLPAPSCGKALVEDIARLRKAHSTHVGIHAGYVHVGGQVDHNLRQIRPRSLPFGDVRHRSRRRKAHGIHWDFVCDLGGHRRAFLSPACAHGPTPGS